MTLTEYTFRILNPQNSNEIKINYRNQKRSHLRVAAFQYLQIERVPSIKILVPIKDVKPFTKMKTEIKVNYGTSSAVSRSIKDGGRANTPPAEHGRNCR